MNNLIYFWKQILFFYLRPQNKGELCMKVLAGDSKLFGFLFVSVFSASVFHLDTIFNTNPRPRMAYTLTDIDRSMSGGHNRY